MDPWIAACSVRELENVKKVNCNGENIALFKTEDGIYALRDRCSHEEAPLSEGEVEEGTVYCPLHYAQFDLKNGRALTLPATEGVKPFPVKVEDDVIFVRMD